MTPTAAPILGFCLGKRKLLSFLVSVAIGVAGLLLWPTPVSAMGTLPTQLGVSGMNTTAGYAGLLSTSVLPAGQTVTFHLEKPDGEVTSFTRTTNKAGSLVVEVEARQLEKAGVYLISAMVGGTQSATSTFIVRAASLDAKQSVLQVEEQVVALGDAGRVLAVLRDQFGNPISDHQLRLIPAGSEQINTPYQVDGVTDADGMVVFEVRAARAGRTSVSLVDVTTGSVLPSKAALTFNEVYGRGGNPFAIRQAQAQAAGDYFVLQDVPDQVRAGESFTVTVEAVDGQAQTLAAYKGKVRFSATDLQAQLPSDYTFAAADAGAKRFSLAVTLVTLGQQTLTVSDASNQQMKGEVALMVTQAGGSAPVAGGGAGPAPLIVISPQPDFITKESQIVVAGTAEPLVTISIYDGLKKVGDVQSTPQGQFSKEVAGLTEGAHDLTIAATGPNGQITTSDPIRVIVDKTAPAIKQIRFEPAQPQAGESMLVLLESEASLGVSRISVEGRVIELVTDADTGAGWYKGSFAAPAAAGSFPVTVTLIDAVGNKAEFANYRTLDTAQALSSGQLGSGTGASGTGTAGGTPGDSSSDPSHPAAPAGMQLAAQRSDNRILFSWPKSDNADTTGYNLYQSVAPAAGFTKVNALPITDVTYLLDQQTNPEARYYKVVAINVSGNELSNSDVLSVAGYVMPGSGVEPIPGLALPTVGVPPSTGPETWVLVIAAMMLAGAVVSLRRA